MLQLEEAVSNMLAHLPVPQAEQINLADAPGRILLTPPVAQIALPPFDNSAVDGYAVRAADTETASRESPIQLRLTGRVPTGADRALEVIPGACARVFTGSLLPAGADAVVMQEDVTTSPDLADVVNIHSPVEQGECVRRMGEDLRPGSRLGEAGIRIGAGLVNLLAACGIERVQVGRQPRVCLLISGSELREPPGPLERGQIFESNRATLTALLGTLRMSPSKSMLVQDSRDEVRSALSRGIEQCEVVITSGGVSVGETDHIKQAFEELGGKIEFWRVAIKPGKPFVFGRLNNHFLLGLPGNPVSAFVTFLLLVRPFLLRWQGAGDVALRWTTGQLGEAVENSGQRRHFLNVILDGDGLVWRSGRQASHRVSTLARANGLLDVASGMKLAAGETVKVLLGE
jgi:molybdopterin molybdotransferase